MIKEEITSPPQEELMDKTPSNREDCTRDLLPQFEEMTIDSKPTTSKDSSSSQLSMDLTQRVGRCLNEPLMAKERAEGPQPSLQVIKEEHKIISSTTIPWYLRQPDQPMNATNCVYCSRLLSPPKDQPKCPSSILASLQSPSSAPHPHE